MKLQIKVTHSIPKTSQYYTSINGWASHLEKLANELGIQTRQSFDRLVSEHVSSFTKTIANFRIKIE